MARTRTISEIRRGEPRQWFWLRCCKQCAVRPAAAGCEGFCDVLYCDRDCVWICEFFFLHVSCVLLFVFRVALCAFLFCLLLRAFRMCV